MTILLYDHIELQEKASRHLKTWKGCHLVMYTLAAVFGIVNFVFLQNTMQLVDENCVLFPRKLEFHMVELSMPLDSVDSPTDEISAQKSNNVTENAQDLGAVPANETKTGDDDVKVKRDTDDDGVVPTDDEGDDGAKYENITRFTGNTTHRLVLDTTRTLFENDSDCQFAEFMPIMSTIFAAVWLTLFTMCPGGGHARSGLQQPWRILMPALLFSLVLVGLTGHSFTTTNKGIHSFCAAFSEVTNSTTCSAVDDHLESSWDTSWGFGARVAATRASSAGVLAAWAIAAALLLARCLAAPDFLVKRTGVYLTKDPQQKIIPHLRLKSPKSRSYHSSQSSPTKRETVSMRSEPTAVTELVSASVEPGPDSAPSSLMATPIRMPGNSDAIEMTYNPQERLVA